MVSLDSHHIGSIMDQGLFGSLPGFSITQFDRVANLVHLQIAELALKSVAAAPRMCDVIYVQLCKSGRTILDHDTEQIRIAFQGKSGNQDTVGVNRFRSLSQYPEKRIEAIDIVEGSRAEKSLLMPRP